MISVRFQGKPFNITVIQVYAPTSNAEEAEVEWFYEDLQDLLELTPKKDVLFIIGDWNAKVESYVKFKNKIKLKKNFFLIKKNKIKLKKKKTNTQKRCPFHYRGLECKSRKSRNTWSNRQIWPCSTE